MATDGALSLSHHYLFVLLSLFVTLLFLSRSLFRFISLLSSCESVIHVSGCVHVNSLRRNAVPLLLIYSLGVCPIVMVIMTLLLLSIDTSIFSFLPSSTRHDSLFSRVAWCLCVL